MKKWVVLAVFILLLGCKYIYPDSDAAVVVKQTGTDTGARKSVQTIHITQAQVYKGNLVLVNADHAVHPAGVREDIVKLAEHADLTAGYSLLDPDIQLSAGVAQTFQAMVQAAGRDGVDHFRISSGYRGDSEQQRLYEAKGADYALPPGHSEHNLGLSLDIGSTLQEMNTAPEGAWLIKHAADYGFILRYPKDKTNITGIQYEPWHFRYVGLPHSKIMQKYDFTLEEYLTYMKKKQRIQVTVDEELYEISYVPVTEDTDVQVTGGRSCEVSGDNAGGVITTVRL